MVFKISYLLCMVVLISEFWRAPATLSPAALAHEKRFAAIRSHRSADMASSEELVTAEVVAREAHGKQSTRMDSEVLLYTKCIWTYKASLQHHV